MYKTDVELLPAPVRVAIESLRMTLMNETDYLHVQVTMDNLREDNYVPTLHVIVEDVEREEYDKGN